MKALDLLCYLNFAEACIIQAALRREIMSGKLTREAEVEAQRLLCEMESPKSGVYNLDYKLPAHTFQP